jgi:hypothetical protein
VSGNSYLTFGDELSDSERKKIWNSGERLLNWTVELLRLRDAAILEQWQVALQRQKAAIPKYAAAMVQAAQMLPQDWPIDIEPPRIPEVNIKLVRPRGKPRGSMFAQAYADAKLIKQQWQRVFGRCRRQVYPTMYDAAAEHHGIQTTQLIDYSRHRNRPSRRGS